MSRALDPQGCYEAARDRRSLRAFCDEELEWAMDLALEATRQGAVDRIADEQERRGLDPTLP